MAAEIYTENYPKPLLGGSAPTPSASVVLCVLWVIPPIIYFFFDRYVRARHGVVEGRALERRPVEAELEELSGIPPSAAEEPRRSVCHRAARGLSASLGWRPQQEEPSEESLPRAAPSGSPGSRAPLRGRSGAGASQLGVPARFEDQVLYASLEFKVPGLTAAKAVAGGLGKVTDVIARHHPGDIIMVHPMVADVEGVSYEGIHLEDSPIQVTVDACVQTVKVLRYMHLPQGEEGPKVVVVLLSHPWFLERTKSSIYPNPMTQRRVLCFWSLWNQAVAQLIVRHRPRIFHCPDFHTAVAPWYVLQSYPDFKVLLVLHNAEYQGSISTDMILGSKLKRLAQIWNLPAKTVAEHLVAQGRFNMLKAGVDFLAECQEGHGACAVSGNYARDCHDVLSLFWPLKSIEGLDNPMLEEERPKMGGRSLQEVKAAAKREVQERFGLTQSSHARILVFVGRLVRQKGVDLIADVAPWILEVFPNAQLVVIGPPGDGFGTYAKEKLEDLAPRFPGRIFVRCEFLAVGPEVKFAADFCLMPSRAEPFGYVDVEFAWHGACMIGAQAGGLGKVPGFYFVAQNRDNLGRLRTELCRAIRSAMHCSQERLGRMAARAVCAEFPLVQWQEKLVSFYCQLAAQRTQLRDTDAPPQGLEHAAEQTISAALDHHHEEPGSGDVIATANSPLEGGDPTREFMTQELSEDELTERVKALLHSHPSMNMKQILDCIGHDVDLEREEKVGSGKVARFLLQRLFGVPIVHILVSLAYVTSSLVTVLAVVMSTQWALRFHDDVDLPGPLGLLMPLFNWVSIPPAKARQVVLWMAQALGFAVGVIFWALLCKRCPPRSLLATNVLLRIPLLLAIAPLQPNLSRAAFLAFLAGFVSSGSLLFIVFNFMMSIVSDFAEIAIRMGTLEMCRYITQWVVMAYTFYYDPSDIRGTKQAAITIDLTVAALPLALAGLLVDLIPGVLLFYAPGPYRDDRFPGWAIGQILKKRSFLLFAASDILGALISFPTSLYIVWWMLNGWTSHDLSWISVIIGVACGGGMGIWAALLNLLYRHGQSVIVPIVLLMAPPTILQVLVEAEVSTTTYFPKSAIAMGISVYALVLDGVRISTFWIARIKILKDRWRLLSYASGLLCVMSISQLISPILCQLAAKHVHLGGDSLSSGYASADQWGLVRAIESVVIWPLPIALLQYAAQLLAAPWINQDMEIALGANHENRDSVGWRALQRMKMLIIMGFGVTSLSTFAWICITGHKASDDPSILAPVWPCEVESLPLTSCQDLGHWTSRGEAVYSNGIYGLNRFGQTTTGRTNCFAKMEQVGGNAFALKSNPHEETSQCRILNCTAEPARGDAKNESEGWTIFSTQCQLTRKKVVAVHLFEWRWTDIARECTEFLGPAGYNAVQISPPAEHIRGSSWSTRYQPVSYSLNSRSGSELEFIAMVQECRTAGVSVMVDAVVNHMASTFDANGQQCKGKQCVGFAGTHYGSRAFHGPCERPGAPSTSSCSLAVYRQDMFHHTPDDITTNCGWPPWNNDRFLCDMRSLPDIDTEKMEPQQMLLRYLFGLFEAGVNFVRIDAASNVYTSSLNGFLNRIPWDYVVQEYYSPDYKGHQQATSLGHVTNFDYGFYMAQGGSIFEPWNPDTKSYEDTTPSFNKLLNMGIKPQMVPKENEGMIFLSNHDSQRERWQSNDPPDNATHGYCCNLDNGQGSDKCAPIYKHGQQYNLAQHFMLAWPWTNNVRVISTYPFWEFHHGPPMEPGNPNTSLSLRVFTIFDRAGGLPLRCKRTPDVSPVNDTWEWDPDRPWLCEHRWEGMAGMVRFRWAIMQFTVANVTMRLDDQKGHLGYSIGSSAFVALHRGPNWLTGHGPNVSYNLSNVTTGMPRGKYCNLAKVSLPEEQFLRRCPEETAVWVGVNGMVKSGTLPVGGMVAIHSDFPADDSEEGHAAAAKRGPLGQAEAATFV